MPGSAISWTDRDEACETPIDHVFREVKDEPLPFVVGQLMTILRQRVGPGHGVGGLCAQEPIEPRLLIVEHVEAHLPARKRQKQLRLS